MATISVIIPVYNAEKYLGDALESVQKQTFLIGHAFVSMMDLRKDPDWCWTVSRF